MKKYLINYEKPYNLLMAIKMNIERLKKIIDESQRVGSYENEISFALFNKILVSGVIGILFSMNDSIVAALRHLFEASGIKYLERIKHNQIDFKNFIRKYIETEPDKELEDGDFTWFIEDDVKSLKYYINFAFNNMNEHDFHVFLKSVVYNMTRSYVETNDTESLIILHQLMIYFRTVSNISSKLEFVILFTAMTEKTENIYDYLLELERIFGRKIFDHSVDAFAEMFNFSRYFYDEETFKMLKDNLEDALKKMGIKHE